MNEYYNNLIVKDLANEITEKEKDELDTWLNSNKENMSLYQSYKENWKKSYKSYSSEINLDEEWKKLDFAIGDEDEKNNKKNYTYLLSFAAAILLSLLYLFYSNSAPTNYSTDSNTKLEVVLGDESRVKLNRNTSIRYTENDQERSVNLTGEAFFKIKKSTKPFVVYSSDAIIEVIGTEFNVNNNGERTKIVVNEGKVKFSSKDKSKQLTLIKGDMAESVTFLKFRNKNSDSDKPAWLNNMVQYENEKLEDVLKDLENRYNEKIMLENETILDMKITLSHSDESLELILTALCQFIDMTYVYEEKRYLIKRKQ